MNNKRILKYKNFNINIQLNDAISTILYATMMKTLNQSYQKTVQSD